MHADAVAAARVYVYVVRCAVVRLRVLLVYVAGWTVALVCSLSTIAAMCPANVPLKRALAGALHRRSGEKKQRLAHSIISDCSCPVPVAVELMSAVDRSRGGTVPCIRSESEMIGGRTHVVCLVELRRSTTEAEP